MKKRNQDDLSGLGAGTSYIHTDDMSVVDTNNQNRHLSQIDVMKLHSNLGNGSSGIENNEGLGLGLTQVEDNQEIMYQGNDIGLNLNMNMINNDHRFNPLEMSQSLLSVKEPKFCYCIPMAKGVCCGMLSLKIVLIIIALIDITIGGAAVGIGVIAFHRSKLKPALAIYTTICGISLLLALAGLYAVATKSMKIIRFYFIWKCIEVCAIPIFELLIIFVEVGDSNELTQSPSITYYVFVLLKLVMRAYFAYLIFSYYKRVDRGEQLLVEYGDRKLSKMIEEIKEEQRKQEWELELTERASSRV